jgi:hypothetical protein
MIKDTDEQSEEEHAVRSRWVLSSEALSPKNYSGLPSWHMGVFTTWKPFDPTFRDFYGGLIMLAGMLINELFSPSLLPEKGGWG